MKKSTLFILFVIFSPVFTNAQNCFNEYDNIVSSLACVDAQASFDINYQAAIIANPDQHKFAFYQNNINYPTQSWYMMDRSGSFFNIHQYGFKKGELDFIITYKIIKRYSLAEIAIVIGGNPFCHKILDIYTDPKEGWHSIEGKGNLLGNEFDFVILLDESDIITAKIGAYMFVRRNE